MLLFSWVCAYCRETWMCVLTWNTIYIGKNVFICQSHSIFMHVLNCRSFCLRYVNDIGKSITSSQEHWHGWEKALKLKKSLGFSCHYQEIYKNRNENIKFWNENQRFKIIFYILGKKPSCFNFKAQLYGPPMHNSTIVFGLDFTSQNIKGWNWEWTSPTSRDWS